MNIGVCTRDTYAFSFFFSAAILLRDIAKIYGEEEGVRARNLN